MTPVSTEELRHTCAQTGICSDNVDGCSCTDAELIERPESAVTIALRADGELVERLRAAGANPVVGGKEYDPPHDRAKRRLLAEAADRLSTQGKSLAELEGECAARGREAFTLRNEVDHYKRSANSWRKLHDKMEERAEAAESALSTAEARALERAWRPFGDAPTDGTKFDVWYAQSGVEPPRRIIDVYWSTIQDWWCTDGVYGPEEPTPLAIAPLPSFWSPISRPRALSTNEAGK